MSFKDYWQGANDLRIAIFDRLEAKTGWGRNELKDLIASEFQEVLDARSQDDDD